MRSDYESDAATYLRYSLMDLAKTKAKLADMGDGDGYARQEGYAPVVIKLGLPHGLVDVELKNPVSASMPGELFLRALFGEWNPRKEAESQIRIYEERVRVYSAILQILAASRAVPLALDTSELVVGEVEEEAAAPVAERLVERCLVGEIDLGGCAPDERGDGLFVGEQARMAVDAVEARTQKLDDPNLAGNGVVAHGEPDVDAMRHAGIVEEKAKA